MLNQIVERATLRWLRQTNLFSASSFSHSLGGEKREDAESGGKSGEVGRKEDSGEERLIKRGGKRR